MKTFDKEIKPPNYRKTKGNKWVDLDTGEVKDGNLRNENGLRSTESLNNTYKRVRDIISFNFNADKSEVFVTLTFDRIVNNDEINKEFNNFWRRWKRHFKGIPMRCIIVVEPTNWNKFHLHGIIKRLDDKRLYLDKNVLFDIWGNGRVKINRVYNKRGLGWYLSSLDNSKKKDAYKYYKQKFQIYRQRGSFEKIDKLDMKHGDVYDFAKENDYILDVSNRFEFVEEESGQFLNGVTEEYFSKKK